MIIGHDQITHEEVAGLKVYHRLFHAKSTYGEWKELGLALKVLSLGSYTVYFILKIKRNGYSVEQFAYDNLLDAAFAYNETRMD